MVRPALLFYFSYIRKPPHRDRCEGFVGIALDPESPLDNSDDTPDRDHDEQSDC